MELIEKPEEKPEKPELKPESSVRNLKPVLKQKPEETKSRVLITNFFKSSLQNKIEKSNSSL